ncbi:hypothetical protein COU75_00315 [Candidatus Peregrinibacteria bacterium CG10_big_fil_rev_8_21_14_0_10_42_8]|nr:MAG: hypothetical protein COU75_00315 [Candidatus Peregrinibacteria bacterium CG10_big_fil_rev_8_21_14_0_10_42_8]
MIQFTTHTARKALQHATVTLGVLSLMLVVYGFSHHNGTALEGRLIPAQIQKQIKWVTINADQIMSGTTIPQDTNIIIHIPEEITRITRRVLFGRSGDTVRYWGYCFPHENEDTTVQNRNGFPGDLFLSEAEREARRQILVQQRQRTFSVFKNLTAEDLNESQPDVKSRVRHQKEVFEGGITCYVMTEKSLPIGSDTDGDSLNSALERAYGSDPNNPDSDADGVIDGLEVLRANTLPTKRDSDGDGIIDGIEDANRNGRFEPGETNPREWDTDRDGLCDGLCKVNKGQDLRGEDKNLNGIYEPDLDEYDPRSVDSDGDGILDEHEVYLCVINGGDDC